MSIWMQYHPGIAVTVAVKISATPILPKNIQLVHLTSMVSLFTITVRTAGRMFIPNAKSTDGSLMYHNRIYIDSKGCVVDGRW